MNGFLVTYTVLHVLLTVLTLFQDIRIQAPRWRMLLRTVGQGAGVSGLILLAQGAVVPALAGAWRYVFPCLVAEALASGAWDIRVGIARHLALAGDEVDPQQARAALWSSIVLGVVLSIPYFVYNYRVAWGPAGVE